MSAPTWDELREGGDLTGLQCPWCRAADIQRKIPRQSLMAHLRSHGVLLRVRPGYQRDVTQEELDELHRTVQAALRSRGKE